MKIRDDVNRALETERQAKTIGNSLGARVRLRAGGADAALLERYRDDLPMLFIVSEVELDAAGQRRRRATSRWLARKGRMSEVLAICALDLDRAWNRRAVRPVCRRARWRRRACRVTA